MVTGTTNSRLRELEKYMVNPAFTQKYISGGDYLHDGVDYNISTNNNITYYLGGIKYKDIVVSGITTTTFSNEPQGYENDNFIRTSYYKNPNKENIISNPRINNDVFINRQEISAFDKNYRLEFIRNLVDLETYAGGNFFKIVKNS